MEEDAMKRRANLHGVWLAAILCLGVLVMDTGTAMAGTASQGSGLSLGAIIFLALFALIIIAQLLPGLVLFGSLLTAIFTKGKQRTAEGGAAAAGGTGGGVDGTR
jgi:hypothetical protein